MEYCPGNIGGDFFCDSNQLKSLVYCNKIVIGDFNCSYNQITSLKYCPEMIQGDLLCEYTLINSLGYFPKICKNIYFNNKELLKYKQLLQKMSDEDFLSQKDFKFWQQFNFIEKAKKENNQILDDLKLNDNLENNQLKINKKKV